MNDDLLKKYLSPREYEDFQRERDQARREGTEAGLKHAALVDRAALAKKLLEAALRAGCDEAAIAEFALEATAANTALANSNAESVADVARGVGVSEKHGGTF